MSALPVHLTGEKETLLGTLYGRALDARAARPILGDTMAADGGPHRLRLSEAGDHGVAGI